VTIACTYSKIGEVNANYAGLLATEQGVTTRSRFTPTRRPPCTSPATRRATAAVTRTFERRASKLTAVSPISGNTDTITKFLADPVEMKAAAHDHLRPGPHADFPCSPTPTTLLFRGCTSVHRQSAVRTENPGFAWNHGDVQPEIVTTWLGMVGPGIEHRASTARHGLIHRHQADPDGLLGFKDDYSHDGRALTEVSRRMGKAQRHPQGQLSPRSPASTSSSTPRSGSSAWRAVGIDPSNREW